jgi:hypothetical protein
MEVLVSMPSTQEARSLFWAIKWSSQMVSRFRALRESRSTLYTTTTSHLPLRASSSRRCSAGRSTVEPVIPASSYSSTTSHSRNAQYFWQRLRCMSRP